MANIDSAFGFRPIKRLDGAAWTGNHTTRKMANNATALNRGDVVQAKAVGYVQAMTGCGDRSLRASASLSAVTIWQPRSAIRSGRTTGQGRELSARSMPSSSMTPMWCSRCRRLQARSPLPMSG